MTFNPAFRMTVYAPRSVDATEATVLTPAAGAPHSDQFIVTSIQGVAGSKPYLDLPTSRVGTIDALNKKTTVGSLTVKLLDARVTPGGGNAARWVTAFVGDGAGGNMLLGRKVKIEQSMNGGSTWSTYFTGRISGPALQGKLWVQVSLRDIADDLSMDLFVGAPHAATASYAALAQVAPLGLMQPVRAAATATNPGVGYAGLALTTPLRGTTTAATGGTFGINLDPTNGDRVRTLVTQALVAAAFRVLSASSNSDVTQAAAPRPKVMLAAAGSGSYAEYDLNLVEFGADVNGDGSHLNGKYSTSVPRILANKTAKAGAASPPAGGTVVDYYIVDPAAQPSDRTPLLIDDVNPITYAQHLCAGYFGRLDASGAVVRAVPFNAGGIDGSKLIPYRNQIRKASKLSTELEALCLQYHWAYFIDGSGAVTLVDLRRTAITAPVATLTDADLESTLSALAWQQDRESAVTSFLGTYYLESAIAPGQLPKPFDTVTSLDALPDVATVGVVELRSDSVLLAEIGPRSADMKPSTFKVDAKGFRYRVDQTLKSVEVYPPLSTQTRLEAIRGALIGYADEIKGPFGLGPSYVDVVCRRASTNAALVTPGKFAALTLTPLPDPATNQRGGTRLALCVNRTEDGPRIKLRLLDAGANAVALPPTLGTPTLSGGTISLPVTLNASSEPARVAYAVTDQSVAVRPADDDPSWVAGPQLVATGTATLSNLSSGQRIWLRARTVPGAGVGFKLPSAWVYPSTTHIDLVVIAAPSGLAISGATLDGLVVTWTNGDATMGVEVFLANGSLLAALDGTKVGPTRPAGTVQAQLPILATSSTYTVGVRHRDTNGGVSNLATLTFVCGAVLATLDPPSDPNGFSGNQDPRLGLPQLDGGYGLAVAATEFPGFTEFQEAVETGVNTGGYGTPVTVAKVANVQGDWTLFERIAPNDGLRRQLTARHVRDGATSSAYTASVVVTPWTAKRLGIFATVVQAEELTAFTFTDSADNTQRTFTWTRGALVDAVYVFMQTLAVPFSTDPFAFAGTLPAAVLTVGTNQYTVTKPLDGTELFLQFEPRMVDLTAGTVRRAVVDPAPTALSVAIQRTVTNNTADLAAIVAAGVADWPVTLDVYEDDPTSAPIVHTTLTANATIDKTSFPALGGRALPQRALRHWWARVTNTGGKTTWDSAAADRDALAVGSVVVLDYRANPAFVVSIDDDTDKVRVTTPTGATKTVTTAPGTNVVTYTVGDVLDDTTTESALHVDQSRAGYKVELQGGGTWLTIWGGTTSQGTLHGQPSNPPTATMRAVKAADGSTEDLYITPKSSVGETLTVFYRDGDTVSAPLYQLCASGIDSTPRFVASATEVGPSDWFAPVLGGSPVHILSALVVRDLQVKRVTIGVQGQNSLVEAWLPWDMIQANVSPSNGTVAIDANGGWSFSIDLPNNAQSCRYGTVAGGNTTGYPSDATTASSGTLLSGRTASVNAGGTLTFGQTIWITIVPFTGTSGGGTQLPAIHIRGSYLTYSASKSINYAPERWQEITRSSTGVLYTQYDGDGNIQTDTLNPAQHQIWEIGAVLPDGVTITQAAVTILRAGSAGTVVFGFDRKAGATATSLGTSTVAGNVSFQTVTISLSESTTGNAYRGKVDLVDQTLNQYIGNLAITYSMGDPKKTV